jgi:hypothetical protein
MKNITRLSASLGFEGVAPDASDNRKLTDYGAQSSSGRGGVGDST